jgi:hypothetical protein
MTGFIACVFLSLNRFSLNGAFEVLEPDDGKLSRPVLRGPGLSNGVRLLDQLLMMMRSVDMSPDRIRLSDSMFAISV